MFWTSRVAMCLCWRECLKISHLDRLVQQHLQWHVFLCTSSALTPFLSSRSATLSLQAFWAPGDTGVVFVGWWHEPFRLGLKYCPNRRWLLFTLDKNDSFPKIPWKGSQAHTASYSHLLLSVRSSLFYVDLIGGKCGKCLFLLFRSRFRFIWCIIHEN